MTESSLSGMALFAPRAHGQPQSQTASGSASVSTLVSASVSTSSLPSQTMPRSNSKPSAPLDYRFDQYLDGGILYLGFMNLTAFDFKRIVCELSDQKIDVNDADDANNTNTADTADMRKHSRMARHSVANGANATDHAGDTDSADATMTFSNSNDSRSSHLACHRSTSRSSRSASSRTRSSTSNTNATASATANTDLATTRNRNRTRNRRSSRSARRSKHNSPGEPSRQKNQKLEHVLLKLRQKKQQWMNSNLNPDETVVPIWKLNIVGNREIGDRGMAYLPFLPPTISDIDLSDCSLSPVGIKLVCQFLKSRRQEEVIAPLSLPFPSSLPTSSLPTPAGNSQPCITRCIMWGNQIGDDGANHIADMLAANTTLQELCIMQGAIGPFGYLNISKSLMFNTHLRELTIYHRKLTELHVWAMHCFLDKNKGLECLDMWSAPPLSCPLVQQLVELVRANPNLKRIKLGYDYPELRYWLTLNRFGRAKTKKEDATDGDWMECIMKGSQANNLDSVFYFLRNKPELCDTASSLPIQMRPEAEISPWLGSGALSSSSTKRHLIQTYRALMVPAIPPRQASQKAANSAPNQPEKSARTEAQASRKPSRQSIAAPDNTQQQPQHKSARKAKIPRSALAPVVPPPKRIRLTTSETPLTRPASPGKVSDIDDTDEEMDDRNTAAPIGHVDFKPLDIPAVW